MFFFMTMGLFFWWISISSTLSLLMVLVYSILSVMYFSFSLEVKVPLFMIILTLSGGLFVLISFVIMFFPSDYKMGMIYDKNMYYTFPSCLLMSFIFFESEISSYSGFGTDVMLVWGNFIFVYIFLIILLFLLLFVVNSILNPSTGTMFSEKKMMKEGNNPKGIPNMKKKSFKDKEWGKVF